MSTDTVTLLPEVTHRTEEMPIAPTATIRREATVMEIANVISASHDFPDCRTPEKAAVRIMAGREMGVGEIASVIGIRVQNGRVSMDATLMAGCIKRSGRYDYKITAHTNDVCAMVFFENGEPAGESAFSMADAKTAGLASKDTWRQYPRNMLFARALSNGARWYCAGIFGGSIYTHEELGYAVDEEGRAIETGGNGEGNELCTRDQRQEICRLVEAVGDSMPGFLAKTGIKLLDELSQYEATKEIKRLEKRLLKAGQPSASAVANQVPASVGTQSLAEPASAVDTLTPAQQTLSDALDESRAPSTEHQREQILTLAARLAPDEAECTEMLVSALARRNCKRIAELNHLQAAALIEAIRQRLEADPPFDPTPATGPLTDPKQAAPLPLAARGTKPK